MGMDLDSGHFMAVKQIPLPDSASKASAKVQQEIKLIQAEIELMRALDHPNIVKYLGIEVVPNKYMYIFLEYIVGGSLVCIYCCCYYIS
jgi:serine/threonine protein kinase